MSVTGPGCGLGFAYAYTADELAACDWRPLPSAAEVLAHNARTGGAAAPWLCLAIPGDPLSDLSVAWLATDAAGQHVVRIERAWTEPAAATLGALYRPITRRGGALPWPEVPR